MRILKWGRRRCVAAACVGLLMMSGAGAQDVAGSQDEIQQRFDAALQAIDEDHLRTARSALTNLLTDYPSLQRARLELARVQYLSYDYDEAERLARMVLDDPNTPVSVQTTVLAFLAQIQEDRARLQQRHIWGPSLYVGTMYDSNVNFGPSRDIIEIGGLVYNVLPASRETSDFAWVVNPALTHTYNRGTRFNAGEDVGLFAWQSLASFYYRGYFDETDYSFGVLTLRTGPAWVVPGKWRATIGLQGDQIWLGGDSLAWFTSLNPNIGWALTKDTELVFDGFFTNRDYQKSTDTGRDGWFSSGLVSVNHFLRAPRVTLQAGVGYRDFDADQERWSYRGPEAFVGVVWNAWRGGSVFARAGYRNFDFQGSEPGFTQMRDDDEWRLSAGGQHEFQSGFLRRWVAVLNWTYTDNDSTIPLYEYDRHEVNLGLSRYF